MKTIEKKNIRGAISALSKAGEKTVFPRTEEYKPSVLRSTAASIKSDTGRRFKVEVKEDNITVTRIL